MKPTFVRRMLASYPNWHQQPFRLSCSEIQDPYLVFETFFERYDLDNIRIELKEMMTDALGNSIQDDPTIYVGLCDNLEKLVEACFVLQQHHHSGDLSDTETAVYENDGPLFTNIDAEEKTAEQPDSIHFLKPINPMEKIRIDLKNGIRQNFWQLNIGSVKQNLKTWSNIALVNELSNYQLPEQRRDLLTFIPHLQRLYEALYADNEINEIKQYTGRDHLSPGLAAELCRNSNFENLSPSEITSPGLVFAGFFTSFSYRYSSLELKDLLNAVITYQGESPVAPDKTNLLLEFEIMEALLYAAWLLNHQNENTPKEE